MKNEHYISSVIRLVFCKYTNMFKHMTLFQYTKIQSAIRKFINVKFSHKHKCQCIISILAQQLFQDKCDFCTLPKLISDNIFLCLQESKIRDVRIINYDKVFKHSCAVEQTLLSADIVLVSFIPFNFTLISPGIKPLYLVVNCSHHGSHRIYTDGLNRGIRLWKL